jgi:hypothetical protein
MGTLKTDYREDLTLQEALRTSDRVRPGSDVVAGSNSFVESSAPVSDETA